MTTWQRRREAAGLPSGGYAVCAALCLHAWVFFKKINIYRYFLKIFSRHCHALIALLIACASLTPLGVCLSVCACAVCDFFPFKSCCASRRRRSHCKKEASMRSSFVFHFTFRVTFTAKCSLLTVASPRLGKAHLQ